MYIVCTGLEITRQREKRSQLREIVLIELFFWVKPTVSLGATSVVAYTYGCDNDRIGPTRCAVIDGAPGDRWSRCQEYRTPPAGAGSARSGLAGGSRRVSTAAPGAFPRSRTTPPAGIRPCGDASPRSSRQGCKSHEVQVLCRQLPGSDG